MGNTMGIDMGNTFRLSSRRFHTDVVETNVPFGTAAEVCEVGLPGPAKHVAIVSVVWLESQERLQMEGSIRSRGASWSAKPNSSSEAIARTNIFRMADPDSPVAPTAL